MLLFGVAEFRNFENRKSKNGNEYKVLKFEDEKGNSLQFYWDGKQDSVVPVMDLVKGTSYDLRFDYRYNPYDRRMQVDLLSIESVVTNE